MTDISQQNLKEPEQTDWDTAYQTSKYQPPPPAVGADGKPIVYFAKVAEIKKADPDQGYLNYTIDFALTRAGEHDGARVRAWASTRPFMKRGEDGTLVPVKGNPNSLGKFLKASGLSTKPQTNADYQAAVGQVNGRILGFTTDWSAYNKDTGEKVNGYNAFPDDPERPGQKKSILRAGDTVNELDSKGNIIGSRPVISDVLFANARVKYFQDPTNKVAR